MNFHHFKSDFYRTRSERYWFSFLKYLDKRRSEIRNEDIKKDTPTPVRNVFSFTTIVAKIEQPKVVPRDLSVSQSLCESEQQDKLGARGNASWASW